MTTRETELRAELAALELEVARLRNALETFIAEHEECEDGDGWMAQMCSMESLHVADEALSTPFTPTALNELIEKVENEWQPIETAPKDEAVFLAWRKHATHPLMVRYEPSYDWFANYDGEHVYALTHWMPLPKPPAMAKGENGC